jgi:hypothetical protein
MAVVPVGMARIEAAGSARARRAGHALVIGRELAVTGIAPVTALKAIASFCGSWRSGQVRSKQTDCEETGYDKMAHGENSLGFIFRERTTPRIT